MIIKNCSVEGIERIEGKRKSDNKPYGFWKLHLSCEFPVYGGQPVGSGNKVLTCTVYDDIFARDHLAIGSLIDVYSRGQFTDYIGESA